MNTQKVALMTGASSGIGYSVRATDHLAITPIMQVFVDPAQDPHDGAAVVAGLHAVYVF